MSFVIDKVLSQAAPPVCFVKALEIYCGSLRLSWNCMIEHQQRTPCTTPSTAPAKKQQVNSAPIGEKDAWRKLLICSSPEARALLPQKHAERLAVLPLAVLKFSKSTSILTALFPEPLQPEAVQELRFITGLEIVPETAAKAELQRAVFAAYRGDRFLLRKVASRAESQNTDHSLPLKRSEDEAAAEQPVPQLLEALLNRAALLNASDVHLSPQEKIYELKYRIDGYLRRYDDILISKNVGQSIIRRVKVLCKLDTTQERLPQEGGFHFESGGASFRLRVSLVPTITGEKAVFRLLDQSCSQSPCQRGASPVEELFALGLNAEQARLYMAYLRRQSGSIILSGPTGSGKSTLLYKSLEFCNAETRHLVSIEDPVERFFSKATQLQVNQELGLGYYELLCYVLRQDPDVIMLGEIRDARTAKTTLTAAITGHLVLSTVHASNCLEVILRLRELGAARALLAMSLSLLVSQRLIPLNCQDCCSPEQAPAQMREALNLPANADLFTSKGCNNCSNTGVSGRIGAFELLPISEAFRAALLGSEGLSEGAQTSENEGMYYQQLRQLAFQAGYRSYAEQVRELLLCGKINLTSALETLGMSPEFFNCA